MSNDELKKGVDVLGKEAARKAAGRDKSDMTASDFDAGYGAGQDASDLDSPTTAKDVVERVRREYKGNEEERAAYREGYAAGANRNR